MLLFLLFFNTKTVYATSIIVFNDNKEKISSNITYNNFVGNFVNAAIIVAIIICTSSFHAPFKRYAIRKINAIFLLKKRNKQIKFS